MLRMRSRAVRAALLLATVAGVRGDADSETPAASFESVPALSAAILSHLEGTPCVRLLTTSGSQGCATQQSVQGDLVELEHEHEAVDGEEVVLLLNASLLLPVLQRARAQPAFRQRVTGVLVARGEGDDAPASFSPLSTFPQVALSSTPNSSYVWNPAGTGDADRSLPFPLLLLSSNSTEAVRARAAANTATRFAYPRHAVRLHYKMQARGDSYACLANGSCEPLGGYSVWTTLPAPPLEDSATAAAAWAAMPTVLVLGKLDAQAALFHDAAVGASASMSSLLTLLAAVELLSSWAASQADSEPARPVRRRLAFAALAGEDWGYLGSTSLVRALKEGKEEVGGMKLEGLALVLELGALGLAAKVEDPKEEHHHAPTTLYLHTQKGGDPEAPDDPLSRALSAAVPGTGVRVTSATPTSDGAMPPGALQAFLRERAAIHADEGRRAPRGHWHAATVTDYDERFESPYAGGSWDTTAQLSLPRMAQAAVTLARTLAALQYDVGPEDDDHGVWPTDPSADAATAEQLMRQLADCLLEPQGAGLDCPLAQTLITPSSRQPHASLYVGVLHGVPPNPQTFEDKSDVARLVWNLLGNRTGVPAANAKCTPQCTSRGGRCVGSRADQPGVCVHTSASFLSTLQPALTWSASDAQWSVNRSLVGDAPVYCESMWPADIGSHAFMRERAAVQWAVLVAGSLVTATAAAVSYGLSSYWHTYAVVYES